MARTDSARRSGAAKLADEPRGVSDTEIEENRDRAASVSPWWRVFVVGHILACLVWALPRPKPDVVSGVVAPRGSDYLLVFNDKKLRPSPIVQSYLFAVGAWQYWDMFAPDPARTDVYSDAEVEFADGTKRIVGYPRMYGLNLIEKYGQERFRKFYERAGVDNGAYLWPMFASQLAKEVNDLKNPPRIVTLRRHWLDIAPPGQPQRSDYQQYAYYHYVITPEDLK